MADKITIGSIARTAGVSVETVRYYQRRGLLSVPVKKAGGFRYYSPHTADRVRFIKRAQVFGMSLNDVQALLKMDHRDCGAVRAMTATKLAAVERQLAELRKLRDCLKGLIAECDIPHGECCPILEQLSGRRPACC